jgi:hypothetical protein
VFKNYFRGSLANEMTLRQPLRQLNGEQQCTSMYSGSNPALLPARPKVTVLLLYGDTTSVLSYLSRDAIDVGSAALIAAAQLGGMFS